MTDISELIERLEKVKWPDEELNWDIARHFLACDLNGHPYGRIPAYTASLDAALTLVPEGAQWSVCQLRSGKAFEYAAWVDCHDTVRAHTTAIALCIAALKAQAANTADRK